MSERTIAAMARVRQLHHPEFWRVGRGRGEVELVAGYSDGATYSTRTKCAECRDFYPCRTVRALDGLPLENALDEHSVDSARLAGEVEAR